jgi:DNA-binding MarR family transcriptional regulator
MAELDERIHQPVRLRIMAALSSLDPKEQVDFSFLKEKLGLTDGNLGAHLRVLEEANYVLVEKTFVSRRPKTFLSASAAGRKAFAAHVAALQSILKSSG